MQSVSAITCRPYWRDEACWRHAEAGGEMRRKKPYILPTHLATGTLSK